MRISDWCSDVCSSDLLRISVSAKAVEQQCVTEYPRHEELTSGSIAAQDADGCAGKVAGRLFGQPDCDLLVRRRHDCHEGTRPHGGRAAGAHFGGQVGGGADFAHASLEPHNPDARSEETTSELQSLMRTQYAVFRCKKKHTNC